MTPQQILAQVRVEMDDLADPPLWTDDELLLYFLEAQNRMAKALGGIADTTAESTDAGVVAGTRLADLVLTTDAPYTAISPYILRIRSARLLTAERDVLIANESDVAALRVRDYGWTQGLSFDDTDTGDVTHGVLGIRDNYVRWIRVPSGSDTCRLHFFRLPYPRPTSWADTTIELPEDVHMHLVTGVRAQCYSKQDAETFDRTMHERMAAKFEMYCDEARKEVARRRYRPRTVQFGGI